MTPRNFLSLVKTDITLENSNLLWYKNFGMNKIKIEQKGWKKQEYEERGAGVCPGCDSKEENHI